MKKAMDFQLGVVKNVVAFGAFVDVGVGHDGLLHVPRRNMRWTKRWNPNGRHGYFIMKKRDVYMYLKYFM